MRPDLHSFILQLLESHRLMTLATNRPDGWPQATTVAYAHEGLLLYCFVSRVGQKYDNIQRDGRVSATIAGDFTDPSGIQGLSLAGRASIVDNKRDYDRIAALLFGRFPQYASWPQPNPALAPLIRIKPEIVSVLDYSKGFGHSDLVNVSEDDLEAIGSGRHDWLGQNLQGQGKS
jgi:hypothetical protein